MIIKKYLSMLSELKLNSNILIDSELTDTDLDIVPMSSYEMKRGMIKQKTGIIINDLDLLYFKFGGTSISWESTLENVDYVLTGGVKFNGLLDALTIPNSFWKGAFSLAPDVEVPEELKHFEQLGWFEHRPYGNGDHNRGCFIKQAGNFPPPIVFYRSGWYTKLEMNLEEYLTTMLDNYAVSGWQFFYIDITEEIPELETVLREMKMVVEQMPLLFPDKDWSYHINKYEETKRKLGF